MTMETVAIKEQINIKELLNKSGSMRSGAKIVERASNCIIGKTERARTG